MPDELLVIGSSSGAPTRHRFPSAYALLVTGKLFLLDCGAPVSTLLYRYGLDPSEVQAIFLSHWHMDHVASLGLLLTQIHQLQRVKPLHVFGPRGTRGKVRRLLADSFIVPEDLSYRLKMTNVKPGKTCQEALLKVTYFKTQHLEQQILRTRFGGKAVACGMIINGPGWRIVYSGDLNAPAELAQYVKGCDLLIHELAHHRPEAVAEFAAEANIPHVLISHIGLEYDESPDKIISAFARRYDGDLIVAKDGTKVRLSQIRKTSKIEVISSGLDSEDYPRRDSLAASLYKPDQIDSSGANFVEALQKDFNLSRRVSYELLQTAQETLVGPNSAVVQPGQMRAEVARIEALSELAPGENEKVGVTLTVNAGGEDVEVREREGGPGLRRGRILRMTEEALEQGGALSRDDLAQILNVNIRTIQRDIQALQSEGHVIPILGRLNEEERRRTYKVRIIELWLDRNDTDSVARWLHLSRQSIERYIRLFLQAVKLHQEEMPSDEIADMVQVPAWLINEYLSLYEQAMARPHQRAKLAQELAKLETQ